MGLDIALVPDRVRGERRIDGSGIRHIRFGDRAVLALGMGVQSFSEPKFPETITVARLPVADAKGREERAMKAALRPPPEGWLGWARSWRRRRNDSAGDRITGRCRTGDPPLRAQVLAADVLFRMRGRGGHREPASHRPRRGVAGIVLLGSRAPPGPRRTSPRCGGSHPRPSAGGRLRRRAARSSLGTSLTCLPSAATMGGFPARLQRTADRYARGDGPSGVPDESGPVATIYVLLSFWRGTTFIRPRCGYLVDGHPGGGRGPPVVKHWPGHGHARDAHAATARVPSLRHLRRMIYSRSSGAFDAGSKPSSSLTSGSAG